MSRSMNLNRIENINNTISVKQDDTGTVVQLKIYDYDGNPVDLKNPDIDKIEVKIGAIGIGFHTIKTPTLLDENGALEFRLDVDDKVPAGTNDVEVHVYYKNGRKRIFPAEDAYKFKVSKSLDAVGKEVFKVTVDYLLEQFDNKKQEIEDEAAALREEIENAIQYVDESITEVRQEFNEQLDQTVDNKMTPFVEVVNEHLAQTEQELDATAVQVAQIQTNKADITYVDALMSNITDGSPKELFYSIGALNNKYPNGAVGPMLVFDASFEDGAHTFIWDGNNWVDTGVYQSVGIKDNAVTTSKLSDEIALKGYPFAKEADVPDKMRRAILDVKIYNADTNKRYSIGTLQKNLSSKTYSNRYMIMIYEITSGQFGNIVASFLEDDYTPMSDIEIIKLTGVLNAEVTIKWSELPDETSLTGMPYSTSGLHPLTFLNKKDIGDIENRLIRWESLLIRRGEEW